MQRDPFASTDAAFGVFEQPVNKQKRPAPPPPEQYLSEEDVGTSNLAKKRRTSTDLEKPQGEIEQGEKRSDIELSYELCKHVVSLPKDFPVTHDLLNPPFPQAPARQYPFVLDPFQRTAIACLELGDSVLVSAHTSAGKTVVAEYAIAMGLRDKSRVIYTSPIKALSNQKYRELFEEFKDVGLMTGDVTINPDASCLVMTTEILRSMLYRGSEIMREVSWVIFDEIHYMRDVERGVVWEETIILLPDKVRYVFLSATIPNAQEFADWIASLHAQPCHVVYTDHRPTPLQHYIFPAGGDGLHLVVDEQGQFREDNFQKALASLTASGDVVGGRGRGTRGRGGRTGGRGGKSGAGSDCYKIVKMIMERNYEPVIVFAFSKRECEGMALQMSKLDFNDETEKKNVEAVFMNAIDSLSEDDKKLPQVEHILPLLRRGIGIHHGGLLPILKEVIEILFQEGLLKALFATETFSMGLNMPAKTVVFTSLRKFDGTNFRWVTSGEYIQMSGRAGRRGLDERGIVISMIDEKIEPAVAKNMLRGRADPLNSTFHLGYNMLLNLLRVEGVDPEYLIKRSFHQFQNDRAQPAREGRLKELEQTISTQFQIRDEETVAEYFQLQEQLRKLRVVYRDTVNQPIHIIPFLQPGRLIKVGEDKEGWGWGVVVNFQKKHNTDSRQSQAMGAAAHYVVDVLLNCSPDFDQNSTAPRPCPPDKEGQIEVVPILLSLLSAISSIRVYIPKDLRTKENRRSVGKTIREVSKRFPGGLPLLDPIEDLKISDPSFLKVIRKTEALEHRLTTNPAFKAPDLQDRYVLYVKKMELSAEVRILRQQLKQSEGIILKDQLKAMKRVLRRLGHTNKENIIETKGRVACEINAADELLLTELIFNGVLNELSVEQIVAVISCFVFEEKSDSNQRLADELAGPLRQLQEAARKIAKVSQECKITIDVEEYVEKFKPHMMDVVHSWCKGAKFADICKMTNIFEGSIIRCMRRLEELLRQLCAAAKAIGNSELEAKFAEGINKIKRDIVFAVSLYL